MITALPQFYSIRTSNRRRVQRHYRFFGSRRGILALPVVNRETEKKVIARHRLSLLSFPFLRISTFPLSPSPPLSPPPPPPPVDLAPPLSRHKSGLENRGRNKAAVGDVTMHRAQVIATGRLIRRISLYRFFYDNHDACSSHIARLRAAPDNSFAQKLKD